MFQVQIKDSTGNWKPHGDASEDHVVIENLYLGALRDNGESNVRIIDDSGQEWDLRKSTEFYGYELVKV